MYYPCNIVPPYYSLFLDPCNDEYNGGYSMLESGYTPAHNSRDSVVEKSNQVSISGLLPNVEEARKQIRVGAQLEWAVGWFSVCEHN